MTSPSPPLRSDDGADSLLRYREGMRHARFALPLALFASACSSTQAPRKPETLFMTGRVIVESYTTRDEQGARLRMIGARVVEGATSALRELRVVVFEDLNGNDVVDADEQRGSWHVKSNVGTAHLVATGDQYLGTGIVSSTTNLRLAVRVVFAANDEDFAIVPMDV